jgi:hypothetical protein
VQRDGILVVTYIESRELPSGYDDGPMNAEEDVERLQQAVSVLYDRLQVSESRLSQSGEMGGGMCMGFR